MAIDIAYPESTPPSGGFKRLLDWFKRLLGHFNPRRVLKSLQFHNATLAVLATEEGKKELDRLVILEAIVLARLKSATDLIASKEINQLVERAGLPPGTIDHESREEIEHATEDKNFALKLWDKCKSVANEKTKGWFKGWIGGKESDGEAEE